MHTPVFHKEVMEALQVVPGKKYIDGTAGEGGHLFTIAEAGGTVLGIDYDADQIDLLQKRNEYSTVTLVHGNFRTMHAVAAKNGFSHVNGVLVDLGLSMRQYRESGKGLSYRQATEKLHMRLQDTTRSVEEILNTASVEEIERILALFGEEPYSRDIAAEIIAGRKKGSLKTVGDLNTILDQVAEEKKQFGSRKEQMFARVYQALRIEINEEIENLNSFLDTVSPLIVAGGRLVIITFHSLEDRIVKRWGRVQREFKTIKVAIPKQDRRSFERSAQLRVFEKMI